MKAVTARDLGIEVTDVGGVFRWLLASFLMGKCIRSTVAVKAYRILVDEQGLDTPHKLAHPYPLMEIRLSIQVGAVIVDGKSSKLAVMTSCNRVKGQGLGKNTAPSGNTRPANS